MGRQTGMFLLCISLRLPQLKLASLKFASCAMLQAHSHEKTFTHAEDALKLLEARNVEAHKIVLHPQETA